MTARRKRSFSLLRDNPVKSAAATLLSIAALLAAAWGVDDRYAHAGDVSRNQTATEIAILELRVNGLRDKVYEGRVRKPTTRAEADILDRYQRELADVEQQIRDKRRALERK